MKYLIKFIEIVARVFVVFFSLVYTIGTLWFASTLNSLVIICSSVSVLAGLFAGFFPRNTPKGKGANKIIIIFCVLGIVAQSYLMILDLTSTGTNTILEKIVFIIALGVVIQEFIRIELKRNTK